MTLHPQSDFSLPEEIIHVARAAYPKGNLSLKMRHGHRNDLSRSSVCGFVPAERATG